MGKLSLLASIRADFCLWKCPVPSEQRERTGHRHFGAETEGRAGPPGVVLFCAAQGVGTLLIWAWLRPGGRAWGLSLWSLQTDYNSAPGHCFQSSVSKGELVPEPQATGERGRQARQASGTALARLSGGPALSRSQDGGQMWK